MSIKNESEKLLAIFSTKPTEVCLTSNFVQWETDEGTYTIEFNLRKNKYVANNYVECAVLLSSTYYDNGDEEQDIPEEIVGDVYRLVNEAVMDYIANNETEYVSDGYNEQMKEAYEWEETCRETNAWLNSQAI